MAGWQLDVEGVGRPRTKLMAYLCLILSCLLTISPANKPNLEVVHSYVGDEALYILGSTHRAESGL